MSSNDRGDEPRLTPSVSSRQRPNRPSADVQRVDQDPRSDGAGTRTDPSSKSNNNSAGNDNAAAGNGNGNNNGNGSARSDVGANGTGKSSANGRGSGNGSANGQSDNVVSLDSPNAAPHRPSRRAKPNRPGEPAAVVTELAATLAPPAPPSVSPEKPATGPVTSPVTSPVLVVPAADFARTAVPPGPPPPAALAPAPPAPYPIPHVVPLPPSVFEDEGHHAGGVSFDGLFDPDVDPAGVPRRQRVVQFTQTGRRTRPRLRRVTRVVRHVDPWSVFKVALCFSLVLYGVCLTAGVLLWNVAYTTGTIDNVQRFFESFGWDTFRFKGGELFHNAWIAGLFAALALTGLIVLAATLFNLITDLVGGIRVSVLEEEVVERNPVVRGPLLRRRTRPVSMITPTDDFGDDHGSPDSHGYPG